MQHSSDTKGSSGSPPPGRAQARGTTDRKWLQVKPRSLGDVSPWRCAHPAKVMGAAVVIDKSRSPRINQPIISY